MSLLQLEAGGGGWSHFQGFFLHPYFVGGKTQAQEEGLSPAALPYIGIQELYLVQLAVLALLAPRTSP
jgi:hypothetical protein